MNNPNKTPKNPSPISDKAKLWGLLLPVGVLCLGFLVGLLWFLRPTVSETEKRELTEFPALTLDSFLSGEFTDGVSLWYSDTYPGREGLIGAYHGIQSLYGLRGEQFQSNAGEEIPDETMGDAPAEPDIPDRPVSGGEGGEQIGGFYLSGDTAYELYAFNDNGARRYAALINRAAEKLAGKAKVYDLIVPLHYSIALSADVQDSLGLRDGGKTINYIYSGISNDVGKVDVYSALLAQKQKDPNAYLYFRTDHHWTATGAYYAYEAYCRKAGITPTPLDSYEKKEFKGFLGTLYSKTQEPAALKNNPDVVEAYLMKSVNLMTTHQVNGEIATFFIVNRTTDDYYQAAGSKYNCFIAGDHPLSEIHNDMVSPDRRGTSVLLVKESFGNAFAPFLVENYEYIYIIDYRYYQGNLVDFVTANGVGDVIFLNNIVAATGSARLSEMERFVGVIP